MNLLLLLAFVTLTGCGYALAKKPKDAEPCTVAEVHGGAYISCPDGTGVFIPAGQPGEQGPAGQAGAAGGGCTVVQLEDGVVLVCADGSSATLKNPNTCN